MKIKDLIRKATAGRRRLCIKQGHRRTDANEMSLAGLYAFHAAEGYRYEVNDGRIVAVVKE